MKKSLSLFSLILFFSAICYAHLCNDVFIQAKDNLAVKVDIRDNQLRISKEASFRVYLLNTMDRDIVDIRLEVISDEFESYVDPDPNWDSFPELETKNQDGSKQYFTVKLVRKKTTKEGKHKIKLRLFNGRDRSMVFKTVALDEAIGCALIPDKTDELKIDGNISRQEWKDSYLCTNFYEYLTTSVKGEGWFKKKKANKTSNIQTRVRFMKDQTKLYTFVDFITKDKNDELKIYIAKSHDTKPLIINVNLQKKKAYLGDKTFTSKTIGNKMEIELGLNDLGVKNMDTFYVNLSRTQDKIKTYWSGNETSVLDPIVYATFKMKEHKE